MHYLFLDIAQPANIYVYIYSHHQTRVSASNKLLFIVIIILIILDAKEIPFFIYLFFFGI